VKNYDRRSLPRASVVEFWATWYIIGLNRTSESKGMAIWICPALWCVILSISIYYAPESDIRVKTYDNLNFSWASVVQFRAPQYIIGLNRTSESRVMAVWICLVLLCLISSISIYFVPQSDIRVKHYTRLNFPCPSMLNFEHLDIFWAWVGHSIE